MRRIRIGTRGSTLALWQANHVADLLRAAAKDLLVELVPIQTAGDQVRDVPLAQIGGEGVFTKAIQDAVLNGQADVAVHSLKDLPTFVVSGLVLAAVPKRGPVCDVLIAKGGYRFDELPQGATLATSSIRRRALVLHRRPDLKLVHVRGNVETRLRRLEEDGELAGLILAQAGLVRLNLAGRITEILDPAWMLPAVGQGALGLECRDNDREIRELLNQIDHPLAHSEVLAERSCLRAIGGGCQTPLGVLSETMNGQLTLHGAMLAPDGSWRVNARMQGSLDDAVAVGKALGEAILAKAPQA